MGTTIRVLTVRSPQARPKSATLADKVVSWPSPTTITLAALMSLCTIPFACTWPSPHAASSRRLQERNEHQRRTPRHAHRMHVGRSSNMIGTRRARNDFVRLDLNTSDRYTTIYCRSSRCYMCPDHPQVDAIKCRNEMLSDHLDLTCVVMRFSAQARYHIRRPHPEKHLRTPLGKYDLFYCIYTWYINLSRKI